MIEMYQYELACFYSYLPDQCTSQSFPLSHTPEFWSSQQPCPIHLCAHRMWYLRDIVHPQIELLPTTRRLCYHLMCSQNANQLKPFTLEHLFPIDTIREI